MGKVLTSDQLIISVKRRGSIPTDQRTFATQDFLDLLNEEIDTGMVPSLLELHEEYLVHFVDTLVVANQRDYAIPDRAIGNKLRAVMLVDSSGNVRDMTRVELEDISTYQGSSASSDYPFYVQDNKIVLLGEIDGVDVKIRMYFYIKPNTLVEDKFAGVIRLIDRNTGVITMSNFPEDFSGTEMVDLVNSQSPNKIYDYDLAVIATDSNLKTVTLSPSDIPVDLKIGDYVCQRGESIVPQLPTELHPVLVQRVVVTCLESMGDTEGVALAANKLARMEEKTANLIDNRVESSNQKINPKYSFLKKRTNVMGRRIY